MSKELEWLDYMESICKEFLSRKEIYMQLNFTTEHAVKIIKIVDTLKQSLQRLKPIDNALKICKKANKQKYVYIKESYGIVKEKFLDDLDYEVLSNRLYVSSIGMYYDFPLKDYGNWWALTKEELENE